MCPTNLVLIRYEFEPEAAMGLFMSDNGYYYIKCDFDGKRLKFSDD